MKSEIQIYSEVRNFIENKASIETLRNMLIEAIDNYSPEIYKNLHTSYFKEVENNMSGTSYKAQLAEEGE